MIDRFMVADASQFTLTGPQVKFVRTALGEGQAAFAKRICSNQSKVQRMEKVEHATSSAEILLVLMVAEYFRIFIPELRPAPAPIEEAAPKRRWAGRGTRRSRLRGKS